MQGIANQTDEMSRFVQGLGLSASPCFDGPEAECPVCCGTIDHYALLLDLTGFEALACDDCGAVLAA